MDKPKDLGTMNSWTTVPPEYRKHIEAVRGGEKHDVTERRPFSCLRESTCTTCGIKWAVDTSD